MRALETHSGLPAMHQLLTAVAALLLSVLLLMLSGGLLGSLVGRCAIDRRDSQDADIYRWAPTHRHHADRQDPVEPLACAKCR